MKNIIVSTLLALMVGLSACTVSAPQPEATQTANQPPVEAPAATEVISLPLVVGSSTEAVAKPAVYPPAEAATTETTSAQAVSLPLVVGGAGEVVLDTSLGELAVVSSRFVDEVNGTRPGPGEKILLVILDRPGDERLTPDNFSLETFDRGRSEIIDGQQVHILTGSGEMIISTMGGWLTTAYEEFAMGFMVPETATTFQLNWPGNAPVEIAP